MKSGVGSVSFRGDFTIETVLNTIWVRAQKIVWKGIMRRGIFIHMQYFSCWLVLVLSM